MEKHFTFVFHWSLEADSEHKPPPHITGKETFYLLGFFKT